MDLKYSHSPVESVHVTKCGDVIIPENAIRQVRVTEFPVKTTESDTATCRDGGIVTVNMTKT